MMFVSYFAAFNCINSFFVRHHVVVVVVPGVNVFEEGVHRERSQAFRIKPKHPLINNTHYSILLHGSKLFSTRSTNENGWIIFENYFEKNQKTN